MFGRLVHSGRNATPRFSWEGHAHWFRDQTEVGGARYAVLSPRCRPVCIPESLTGDATLRRASIISGVPGSADGSHEPRAPFKVWSAPQGNLVLANRSSEARGVAIARSCVRGIGGPAPSAGPPKLPTSAALLASGVWRLMSLEDTSPT